MGCKLEKEMYLFHSTSSAHDHPEKHSHSIVPAAYSHLKYPEFFFGHVPGISLWSRTSKLIYFEVL